MKVLNLYAGIGGNTKQYVRVKLNHSEANKAKGFYLLLVNGNTYSDKKDEFIVEKRFVKLLKERKVKHEVLPLDG